MGPPLLDPAGAAVVALEPAAVVADELFEDFDELLHAAANKAPETVTASTVQKRRDMHFPPACERLPAQHYKS
jgi:hypothetical protein